MRYDAIRAGDRGMRRLRGGEVRAVRDALTIREVVQLPPKLHHRLLHHSVELSLTHLPSPTTPPPPSAAVAVAHIFNQCGSLRPGRERVTSPAHYVGRIVRIMR